MCCDRPRVQPHSRQVSRLRNLSVLELWIKGMGSSHESSSLLEWPLQFFE